ncbi:MAG: Rep protein [CRESS virus sp. ctwD22]|nr:MAG: Rep protein [CRESS virus sp. ctwD22]
MGEKIEQIEQMADAGGNTNSPASKRQSLQYTYWCFTFNNYEEEQIEQIEQILKHECKWYLFQKEIGTLNGTPHLQGTICLIKKQRLTELRRINPSIHWEPTKSVQASKIYCTKKETGNGQIYSYGIDIPEELELDEPYGWQLQILDIIKTKPDKRSIHWFWEPYGGKGKSSFCKYLVAKHNALMVTGKSNDMYHMISKFPNKRKIICVDIPRSVQDYINYGAIEQIKNGLIFSGKYEGCQIVFNTPHIFVFANEEPDYDKMSLDRWNVIKIK